jgi:hypothetical protein
MKKNITIMLIALLLGLFATAFAEENGGYAGAYLQLSMNPRATGMGNAYTAVSDDISAVFFNPGAAAQVQRVTFGGAYRDLSYQRSLQQLAILFPVRGEAAIGISAQMASMGNIIGRTSRGEPTGTLDNMDAVFSVVFSRRFSRFISIGGDVRYFYKKLETTTSNSAGFDVGGMLHLRPEAGLPVGSPIDLLRLAVVVRNIAAKYPWSTGDYWGKYGYYGTAHTDKVPILAKVGASVLFLKSKLLLAADGEVDEKRGVRGYFGGEYKLVEQAALRAGLSHGKPTFGIGFKVPVGKITPSIDIAVEQAQNLVGWESIIGFSLGL